MPVENVDDLLALLSRDEPGLERLRRFLLGEQAVTARLDRVGTSLDHVETRLDRIDATLERLAEAQLRTEQRLDVLTQRVDALAEAQVRTEQRLDVLTQRVDALAEAQVRTEAAIQALVERMDRLDRRMDGFEGRMGNVEGELLESRYERRFGAYFGPWLSRPTLVSLERLYEDLSALEESERSQVFLVDLVVAGTPRVRPELGQVYLAVEVSATIDVTEVDRAADRAAILGRAGIRAVPVACGRGMTEGAREEISTRQVAVLIDGKRMGWDEALATWCPPPAAA